MLLDDIKRYEPVNDQEKADKEVIISLMEKYDDIFYRENPYFHMTASAWIVNKNKDRILMCYHNLYDSWSWLGGHADGEEDLLKVALKEVEEESGLHNIRPLSNDIFSLEILSVDGHVKRGKYVNTHMHLNVTYLIEADENELTHIKEDENSGLKWFTFDGAIMASNEKWFKDNIYSKLNSKLKEMIYKGSV